MALTGLASMGETGGMTGSCTRTVSPSRDLPAEVVRQVVPGRRTELANRGCSWRLISYCRETWEFQSNRLFADTPSGWNGPSNGGLTHAVGVGRVLWGVCDPGVKEMRPVGATAHLGDHCGSDSMEGKSCEESGKSLLLAESRWCWSPPWRRQRQPQEARDRLSRCCSTKAC